MEYWQIGDYLLSKIVANFNLDNEKIINKYDYIKKHNELQDDIAKYVNELLENLNINNKQICVDYLLELYTSLNNNTVSNYIITTKQNELYNFYNENQYFKKDLISCFINALINNNYKLNHKESAKENYTISFLPDMLRDTFITIYSNFSSNGVPFDDILNLLYYILSNEGEIISNDDNLNNAIAFLQEYNSIFIRLMYSDVYMGIMSQNTSENQKNTVNHILKEIELTNYQLVSNEAVAKSIIRLMIKINLNEEKRIYYKNNASSEVKKIYQRINFLYPLEDTKYSRG